MNVLSALSFTDHAPPLITVNSVDPGFCYSEIRRDVPFGIRMIAKVAERLIGRTAEEGARQLVWAALAKSSEEGSMRGAYISSMEIREPGDFVISEKGKEFREELFVSRPAFLYRIDES